MIFFILPIDQVNLLAKLPADSPDPLAMLYNVELTVPADRVVGTEQPWPPTLSLPSPGRPLAHSHRSGQLCPG